MKRQGVKRGVADVILQIPKRGMLPFVWSSRHRRENNLPIKKNTNAKLKWQVVSM